MVMLLCFLVFYYRNIMFKEPFALNLESLDGCTRKVYEWVRFITRSFPYFTAYYK